jgi:hypothetical protein
MQALGLVLGRLHDPGRERWQPTAEHEQAACQGQGMSEAGSPKRPMGQPSKYRPEYCQDLIAHMEQGRAFQSFGKIVRVSKKTLQNWLKAHPEFEEAKGLGESLSFYWWESKILEAVEEGVKINAAPLIFALKNRFGWRDKSPEEEADDEAKKAEQTPKLTPAEIVDIVKQARGSVG